MIMATISIILSIRRCQSRMTGLLAYEPLPAD